MSDPLRMWKGQSEFYASEADEVALLCGAGYGKSHILGYKAVHHVLKNQGWHHASGGADLRPLRQLVTAPASKYLTQVTIPYIRAAIRDIEERSGQKLTASSGRGRDGFIGGQQPQIEFASGITTTCFPLVDESSVVGYDAFSALVDEVTFVSKRAAVDRLRNRVRDSRALFRQIAYAGTPEQGHWFYDEMHEMDGSVKAGKHVITASSLENPTLPDEWFQRMAEAGEFYVRQQVMGEWVQGSSGERFAHIFDPSRHCIPMPGHGPGSGEKYILAFDPGYRTGSWLILWHNKSTGEWWVIDELVVDGMTVEECCQHWLDKGYRRRDFGSVATGHDVDKRRTGHETDQQVIKRMFGHRPRFKGGSAPDNVDVRIREDAIDKLLREGRLKLNIELLPRNRKVRCLANSLKQYRKRVVDIDGEKTILEQQDSATKRKWAHPIDALHYGLLHSETRLYAQVRLPYSLKGGTPAQRRKLYMKQG